MLISTQLFFLMTFGLLAQTISGTVYDACIGTPLAGATISIQFDPPNGPPMSYTLKTKPDGTWDFSFFASDPDVPYHIYALGGASSPTSYVYYRKNGNQSGFDFSLLQKQWDITINGEEISWQNNPQSPLTLCRNMDNCLKLTGLEGDPFVPRTDHCFQVRLYDVPDAGSGNPGVLLASSFCDDFVDRRPDIPCGDEAFDLNELFAGLTTIPPLMRLEVWHFCCNRECNPGETDLLNKEVVFIEVSEIGPAQACFVMVFDEFGNYAPPGEDCENALAACQFNATIKGECSSGVIDRYWMVINEYDLNTCEFIQTVADGSSDPDEISSLDDIIQNLNVYAFHHWAMPGSPYIGYFVPSFSGNPPATYEIILTVENECGAYSTTGWFSNVVTGCLTGGGGNNDAQFLGTTPFLNSGQTFKSESFEIIGLAPNPVNNFLTVELSSPAEQAAEIIVHDIAGRPVLNKAADLGKGNSKVTLDVSVLSSGVYLLEVRNGVESMHATFVKN